MTLITQMLFKTKSDLDARILERVAEDGVRGRQWERLNEVLVSVLQGDGN